MINVGDIVEFKYNWLDIFSSGEKAEVLDIKYNSVNNIWKCIFVKNGMRSVSQDFIKHKWSFKNQTVNLNDKVKFKIKELNELQQTGWTFNDKKHLVNKNAYYKFTKKKLELCGKVLKGHIKQNPKGKLCIRSENGWLYDESMIQLILIDENKFKEFESEISFVNIRGLNTGTLIIGDYQFNKKESNELLRKLLTFNEWIVDDL